MDKAALNKDLNKNIPLITALLGIWNRNFLGMTNYAIIPYSQALSRFTAHIQQLDMESNGKESTKRAILSILIPGQLFLVSPGPMRNILFSNFSIRVLPWFLLSLLGLNKIKPALIFNGKGPHPRKNCSPISLLNR